MRRLKLLDQFGDLQQVLSLANPPLEYLGSPAETPDLARMANDGLADLCRRYPERFPTFIASLPMNNIEASLAEIDRAVSELGAKGVQVFTNVAGAPLSDATYRPIFARMVAHDLPVWVHPMRGPQFSDYTTESASENEIWFTFGWPYETTACMTRLIYSGLFDELPQLKIITHHMGGMIPYFAGRIGLGFRQIFFGTSEHNPGADALKRPPAEYFKLLYADTALNGEVAATQCGHAYFGTAHCLFATDAPFDPEQGQTPDRQHDRCGQRAADRCSGARPDFLGQCACVAEIAIRQDEVRRHRGGDFRTVPPNASVPQTTTRVGRTACARTRCAPLPARRSLPASAPSFPACVPAPPLPRTRGGSRPSRSRNSWTRGLRASSFPRAVGAMGWGSTPGSRSCARSAPPTHRMAGVRAC